MYVGVFVLAYFRADVGAYNIFFCCYFPISHGLSFLLSIQRAMLGHEIEGENELLELPTGKEIIVYSRLRQIYPH